MLENNKNNKTVNNNNSLEVEIEEQINSDSSSFNSLNNLNNNNLDTTPTMTIIQEVFNKFRDLILDRNEFSSFQTQLFNNYNFRFSSIDMSFNSINNLIQENIINSNNILRSLYNSQSELFGFQQENIRSYSHTVELLGEVTSVLNINFQQLWERFENLEAINSNTFEIVSELLDIISKDKINQYTIYILVSFASLFGYFTIKYFNNSLNNFSNIIVDLNNKLNLIETINSGTEDKLNTANSDIKNLIFLLFGFFLAKLKK